MSAPLRTAQPARRYTPKSVIRVRENAERISVNTPKYAMNANSAISPHFSNRRRGWCEGGTTEPMGVLMHRFFVPGNSGRRNGGGSLDTVPTAFGRIERQNEAVNGNYEWRAS